ncbi:thioredoxin-2-like [Centruroides sculpturatus]|uniref:thioredoxin-2-like n=1 Tax=Centruroides sculpturatus TaxID=218467 RepID=UPI000C6CFF55|nr:thioredoxin-2-like [Centruroides sculpturatus]
MDLTLGCLPEDDSDSIEEEEHNIHIIVNKFQLDQQLENAKNKIVLIYFFAYWCGLSMGMDEVIEDLADNYRDKLHVLKIDASKHREIAKEYKIKYVPTFIFVFNGKNIEEFEGADQDVIRELLERNLSYLEL